MLLKRFRVRVIMHVLLLTAWIALLVILATGTTLYATMLVTACLILFQFFALVRCVERTNQQLSGFLTAVKHGDFSQTFRDKDLGSSFSDMVGLFNEVMEKLRLTRSQQEEQYRYLQTVIHHVGVGLISFGGDGRVDLLNHAAKQLLKVSHLNNINHLARQNQPLAEALLSLKHGEKALVKINEGEMELMIRAAEFRLQEQKYTLVSLQNIVMELQEKETEAWQNLIRVLTHEIMNSMTPITSMAATLLDLLGSSPAAGTVEKNPGGVPAPAESMVMDEETLEDMTAALTTIRKRGQGLTHFIESYRNLTLLPKPSFKLFGVAELFGRVEKLMEHKFKERGIGFRWRVEPESLELTADIGLLEQVIINLVLNAVDALEDVSEPELELSAEVDDVGRPVIRVVDNGPGIVAEAVDRVFIPFFTTKQKGSGIGLSLTRQIMKLHRGTVNVQSVPDVKTVFSLKF